MNENTPTRHKKTLTCCGAAVALLMASAWNPVARGAALPPAVRGNPIQPAMVARGPGKAPVTLNVDKAPIRSVLRLMFRRADQSYVFGPRVAGTVTASLQRVPFDTALDQVLAANSVPLTKTMAGTVYVIHGPVPVPQQRSGAFRRRRSYRQR